MKNNSINLTLRPPRSPRVRLGGYTILPRIIDKARATIAGTEGDYIYNNPIDHFFFGFTGITAESLMEYIKTGAGDWQILLWVNQQATSKRSTLEIKLWADWTETVAFTSVEMRDWFTEQIKRLNPAREDISAAFDYLDLDDHVSFGGEA